MNTKFKILVADDDPDDRDLFREAFQKLFPMIGLKIVDDGVKLLDHLESCTSWSGRFRDLCPLSKMQPPTRDQLKTAFDAHKLKSEVEVYVGSQHGWCPPDSGVYNMELAEKAWSRLLATWKTALA